MKKEYKALAIKLRKKGKTYSEILQKVPVAKSTLSEWFKSVELAVPQKQRITLLKKEAGLRGALARKTKRLAEVALQQKNGLQDIGMLSQRDLWLIGIALYWGEGSKQNLRSPSSGVMFANQDYKMLVLFIHWLDAQSIDRKDIYFELYIHEDRRSDALMFRKWWAKRLRLPLSALRSVYFKKGNSKTRRVNVGDLYHGLIRIRVRSSTSLNRQIHGWIEGVAMALDA